VGTRLHGRQVDLTEALVALSPVEGRRGLSVAVDCSTIITLGPIGEAKIVVRQRVQDNLTVGHSEREGTLGGNDGLVIRAHERIIVRQKEQHLSQPTRVIKGLGKGLGFAQRRQDAPKLTKRAERRAQGEPQIDGLLDSVAFLRQMRQSTERLLKIAHGLAVGRACQGLLARLPAV
jgi:hypothetical protein